MTPTTTRLTRRALALLAAAGAGSALLAVAPPAGASSGTLGTGYALARPLNGQIIQSYSSAGGTVTVARSSTGVSFVTFGGIAGGTPIAHVTAIGNQGRYCTVGSIGDNGTNTGVEVRCFSATGSPSDVNYYVGFSNVPPSATTAFLWATEAGNPGYVPMTRFNGQGGTIQVGKTATGRYTVRLDGFGITSLNAGTVKVTALTTSAAWCNPTRWAPNATVPSALDISVACRNGAGAYADTRFLLSYVVGDDLFGASGVQGAYHRHTQITVPTGTYTSNRFNFNWDVARQDTWSRATGGNYLVTIKRSSARPLGNVQISALSATNRCTPTSLDNVAGNAVITIQCNGPANTFPDTKLVVSYLEAP